MIMVGEIIVVVMEEAVMEEVETVPVVIMEVTVAKAATVVIYASMFRAYLSLH